MICIHGVVISINSGVAVFLGGWPLPYYVVGMLTIILVLGDFTYRWIEQPIGRQGKKIIDLHFPKM